MHCELCNHPDLSLLHHYITKYNAKIYKRVYYLCSQCQLIFLQADLRLNLKTEKHRYSQHKNSIEDLNYLKFLDKLVTPLKAYLNHTDTGLDYGCGPSVVLAQYLSLQGFTSLHYDPLFFPSTNNLQRQYNFITCTEVIEHLYQPLKVFKQINSLLKPGAYLGLMTKLYQCKTQFATWHYHNDITHVSFYSKETINWIAKQFFWKVLFLSEQVIILQKPPN